MTHMKSLLAAGFLVAGTIAAQPAAAGTFWDVYGPIGRSGSDDTYKDYCGGFEFWRHHRALCIC